MYKALDRWLLPYLRRAARRGPQFDGTRHLLFCLADHFEPFRGGLDSPLARESVRAWAERFRAFAARCREAAGRTPRWTWFYPAEEYDPECLDILCSLVREGYGEVEIHLHHRNDTAAGLRDKLCAFQERLHRAHGLLGADGTGRSRYGFIHGNWALCNSDPGGDWCGVDEELGILRTTGCYADFTFPSAPSPTQPRMVNALYYAADFPGRPRGHERGVPARVRRGDECQGALDSKQKGAGELDEPIPGFRVQGSGDAPSTFSLPCFAKVTQGKQPSALLLITGPLALDWRRRKWGILPRIENAELSGANPPRPERLDLWVRQGIHVEGRPEWVFVKVHTHGLVPANRESLLGAPMLAILRAMAERFGDGKRWRAHFVTAREMYNVIRAAEDDRTGEPDSWRNYEIAPPPVAGAAHKE